MSAAVSINFQTLSMLGGTISLAAGEGSSTPIRGSKRRGTQRQTTTKLRDSFPLTHQFDFRKAKLVTLSEVFVRFIL